MVEAKLSTKDRVHLKKFVAELKNHRGRHTELVTVYVPAGYELTKVLNQMTQEQGTATNIKSKSTRDNVIAALEKMIQLLKSIERTPTNGLAAFAGNIAEREGQQDYQSWWIEPPLPINQRLYRCDKEFVLEPLLDLLDDKEVYGLVVMDRRDGNIALLKGKTIIPLADAQSQVPGKFKAGGQSSVRFARNRELAAKDFYKKIAEMMKASFYELEGLQGIIVGGPGPTKYDFVEGNYILDPLKKKIIGIKDLSYTGDFGVQELVERSEDLLAGEDLFKEKKVMSRFFELLATKPGSVSYGKEQVKEAVSQGAVELIILSESVDEQIIEEFERLAEPFASEVTVISTETREGVQLKSMGGIVAILRYDRG
ncbi:MAG: peptide chain release factor aRF-1 [Candidatus Woesearchaeota archaeon]|nr:MAG: peptide chain release factor aRF-1 [Candidatus Woesearchaeota archaeon]